MQGKDQIDIKLFKLVSRAMAESDDLEIIATNLTQLLVSALGVKGCAIFVLNPQSDELEMLASFGLSIEYINKGPVIFNKSISGHSKGEPIVISDVSDSGLLQYPQFAQTEGIQAIVSLPVQFKGHIIGALRLYQSQAWQLSEQDLDFLTLLADNIGLAMMYTRLQHALQSVRESVDAIHAVWLQPT
jgi:GAF domain-containing protein